MDACPSDDVLIELVEGRLSEAEARDLELHSDQCALCSQVLSELARSIVPDPTGVLGERYRLLEPLGAGGMGVVYAAFDTKLKRKVAIKRLHAALKQAASTQRRARFLREAELLAACSHPNVLTVHDVGGEGRGVFVVMELVDGWPVSRWLAETRPSFHEIAGVYRQAALGLAAAHQVGIVHRDVKPDNILVARSGRVLVSDFGLAGLSDGSSPPIPGAPPSNHRLTRTGAAMGTPGFMAPEQLAGSSGDALSDQFSFCISLYLSLHGRRPFPGMTTLEIAASRRHNRLLPNLKDGVPHRLDRVLEVGLDPDPSRRFASMEALIASLDTALRPIRWRTPLALGAVLCLTVVTGVYFARRQPSPVHGTVADSRLSTGPAAPAPPASESAPRPADPSPSPLSPSGEANSFASSEVSAPATRSLKPPGSASSSGAGIPPTAPRKSMRAYGLVTSPMFLWPTKQTAPESSPIASFRNFDVVGIYFSESTASAIGASTYRWYSVQAGSRRGWVFACDLKVFPTEADAREAGRAGRAAWTGHPGISPSHAEPVNP